MTKLDSLERESLSQKVASSIRHEIVRGRLKPGDRLPTEHKLADTLGVSRNAVREGLALLRQDGLVRSRQGVGAFVTDPAASPTLTLDETMLKGERGYRSLFELRRILETGAAALAASNRSRADLKIIEEAFKGMAAAGIWSEDGVDQDIAFHRAIAGATGNGFVLVVIAFVDDLLKDSIREARRHTPEDELHTITLAEHEAILKAIKAADPEAARAAMLYHLNSAESRLGL